MEDFKVGDFIEATKGESVIRGRLEEDRFGLFITETNGLYLKGMLDRGWTIRKIEPPFVLPERVGSIVIAEFEGSLMSVYERYPLGWLQMGGVKLSSEDLLEKIETERVWGYTYTVLREGNP